MTDKELSIKLDEAAERFYEDIINMRPMDIIYKMASWIDYQALLVQRMARRDSQFIKEKVNE